MTIKQLDVINLFLLFLSAGLSVFFPLEVFILSYFVLGPLHYVTEINWLHTKQYFIKSKTYVWLAFALSFIIALNLIVSRWITDFIPYKQGVFYITNYLMFLLFVLPVSVKLLKQKKYLKLLFVLLIAIPVGFFWQIDTPLFVIAVFLPTVIHVYVFTLLFMFFGAKKSNSTLGLILVPVALLIPLLFVYIPVDKIDYWFPEVFKTFFIENNFHKILVTLGRYLGVLDGRSFYFYEEVELKLLMFFSFIYLYHYLNWFSKTSVIGWHKKVNKTKIITVMLFWGILLILVYFKILVGLFILFFLSFLHVFLEFPLNIETLSLLLSKKK